MRVLRWVIAGLLLAVAVVVAPAAERLVWSVGHDRTHPGDRADLMSHVRDLPSGGFVVWLGILVLLTALNLRWPVNWPRVALLGTVPVAVFMALAGLVDLNGQYMLWILAGGVGSAVVAWGAARLAGLVVTRPLSPDVTASRVELVFRLRDGSRLRVQGTQLLLDLLPEPTVANGTALRLAIPYEALALVQPGVLDSHARVWPLPNGSAVALSPGSSLRLVGSGQQWVLPLDDAWRVATIVTERARTQGGLTASDSAQGTLPEAPQPSTKRVRPWRTSPWPFDIAVLAACGLAGASINYAVTEDPLGWITFALCVALVLGGVRLLRRVRTARDQAEANPRPAGAEAWGDHGPGRSPVVGWSPVAGETSA